MKLLLGRRWLEESEEEQRDIGYAALISRRNSEETLRFMGFMGSGLEAALRHL